MRIIKRNSSEAEFDREKIANAIRKANFASDPSERVPEEAIQAMTGATISSRAVTKGVKQAVEEVAQLTGGK